jgi:hypothetical protein
MHSLHPGEKDEPPAKVGLGIALAGVKNIACSHNNRQLLGPVKREPRMNRKIYANPTFGGYMT